jgi:hypothetical protein
VPGLSDMEELLINIRNRAFVGYMREALACYHAGAYRGCIVMSFIALFDDLRQKLGELARTNSTAKSLFLEVQRRAADQEVFEKYMVDQMRGANLLLEADIEKLELIRNLRNKAAHPSGVHASPEEARFVFFEVIDKFLSKELLKTTHAVDALIERLPNANLIPGKSLPELAAIAADEIEIIHPSAFPYLMNKLVEHYESEDENVSRNARRLLIGLAAHSSEHLAKELQARFIKAKAEDETASRLICQIISANGTILRDLDESTVLRLKTVLESAVENTRSSLAVTKLSHPVTFIASMLNALGEEELVKRYGTVVDRAIEKYAYTSTFVDKMRDLPKLKKKLVAVFKDDAGSSDFGSANRFAGQYTDLDALSEQLLTTRDAFSLVVRVNKAADHGAFSSKDLRGAKFATTPNLRSLAVRYAEEQPEKAREILAKYGVEDLGMFLEETLLEVKEPVEQM